MFAEKDTANLIIPRDKYLLILNDFFNEENDLYSEKNKMIFCDEFKKLLEKYECLDKLDNLIFFQFKTHIKTDSEILVALNDALFQICFGKIPILLRNSENYNK